MKHLIKTDTEIKRLRESCGMLAQVLSTIIDQLEPGLTTFDIDSIARKEIKALGGKPAFYGYQGFPGAACVSINDQVVHGIPGQYELVDGDIISVDCGVEYNGMISDSAFSQIVGKANPDDQALLDTTYNSLMAGISKVRAGVKTGDIGQAIQTVLEDAGYGVVKDLVGHGVGRSLHEPPEIPNFGKAGTGKELLAGMTIAIEPMASRGSWKVDMLPDNWTVVTRDGSRSAHFEHTILITENGSEVLTTRADE